MGGGLHPSHPIEPTGLRRVRSMLKVRIGDSHPTYQALLSRVAEYYQTHPQAPGTTGQPARSAPRIVLSTRGMRNTGYYTSICDTEGFSVFAIARGGLLVSEIRGDFIRGVTPSDEPPFSAYGEALIDRSVIQTRYNAFEKLLAARGITPTTTTPPPLAKTATEDPLLYRIRNETAGLRFQMALWEHALYGTPLPQLATMPTWPSPLAMHTVSASAGRGRK